ncbi:DUF1707 domain-containing protein [Actinomadura vinacea]|uniref:DUF1707 domain-containing protein n=1 Tax=Actinomadura vinacea TaxID=115336 RepID=A0ABN3KC34_9ACTN
MADNREMAGRASGTAPDATVSDAERDAVVTRLNRACGEGLLSLTEYSDRVQEARVVRTRPELDRLVDDLPASGRGTPEVRTEWHVVPVGGLRRHGRWHMDRHLVSLTVLGGTHLDLRDAELAAPEVTVTKVSVFGRVTVCVPRGVRVVLEGGSLLGLPAGLIGRGGAGRACGDAAPDAPTLRIRTFSLLGGVTVQTPGP